MALCVSGASLRKDQHIFWLTVERKLPNSFQRFRLLPALAFAALFLPSPLALHAQSLAAARTVITIAGSCTLGYFGDGDHQPVGFIGFSPKLACRPPGLARKPLPISSQNSIITSECAS